MKMIQGFEYPDGRKVAVFDHLGVDNETVRSKYEQLSDMAREYNLTLMQFPRTGSPVAFATGNRIVYTLRVWPEEQITYLSGFFMVANRATRILTGKSLLSEIRDYARTKTQA